jgi:hypothetical protein
MGRSLGTATTEGYTQRIFLCCHKECLFLLFIDTAKIQNNTERCHFFDNVLLNEVALHVVFVEHVKHVRRLAPCGGVDVLAIIEHTVLTTCRSGEREHQPGHKPPSKRRCKNTTFF